MILTSAVIMALVLAKCMLYVAVAMCRLCIVCHYRGDSKLVTSERREREHQDGQVSCIRRQSDGVTFCYDCDMILEGGTHNHVCAHIVEPAPAPSGRYGRGRPYNGRDPSIPKPVEVLAL